MSYYFHGMSVAPSLIYGDAAEDASCVPFCFRAHAGPFDFFLRLCPCALYLFRRLCPCAPLPLHLYIPFHLFVAVLSAAARSWTAAMVDLRSCGVMAGSDDVASRARQTQNQSCELLQTTSLTSYKHASLNKLSSFLARPAHGSHGGSGTVPQEVCSYSSHCSHSHSDLIA